MTTALKCCRCGVTLDTMFYGMGDGTGQRFGCPHCYWRGEAERLTARCERLEARRADLEGALDGIISEADEANADDSSNGLSRALCGRFRWLAQKALAEARARGAVGS